MSGCVSAIFFCLESGRPSKFTQQVTVMGNYGMQGDRHARENSSRQILLVSEAVLEELRLRPGALKENFTIRGANVNAFPAGTRLRVGSVAEFEVTEPCSPCERLNAIRAGLKEKLAGRRGVYAKVSRGGIIRVDDAVTVLGRPAPTDVFPLVSPPEA